MKYDAVTIWLNITTYNQHELTCICIQQVVYGEIQFESGQQVYFPDLLKTGHWVKLFGLYSSFFKLDTCHLYTNEHGTCMKVI